MIASHLYHHYISTVHGVLPIFLVIYCMLDEILLADDIYWCIYLDCWVDQRLTASFPSVLWQCLLDDRKGIRPAKFPSLGLLGTRRLNWSELRKNKLVKQNWMVALSRAQIRTEWTLLLVSQSAWEKMRRPSELCHCLHGTVLRCHPVQMGLGCCC